MAVDEYVEVVSVELDRVPRALLGMAQDLDRASARTLVDSYYQIQEIRKSTKNQARAMRQGVDQGPPAPLDHISDQTKKIEAQIKNLLGRWALGHPAGEWAMGQVGIGPVLAAGLLAHIDFERAQTSGGVWRFAGLDPTVSWGKGEKRPYNARLKVLAWKIGDSMVKLKGKEPLPFYAGLYVQRKAYELEREGNLRSIPLATLTEEEVVALIEEQDAVVLGDNVLLGGNAKTAAETLEKRKFRDKETKATYERGQLPPGRLDLRARRYAEKIFLAHFWQVGREAMGLPAPRPWAVEHGGHAHVIEVPAAGASWEG